MSLQAPPGQPMKRLNFANTYGKTSTKTRQQLWVIHTGETPLDHGYAASLTRWAAKDGDPQVSWHRFVDPSLVVTWIPLNKGAWHATWANGISIGYEQSGYAKFTSEWLTAKGLAQIDLLAQQIVADGIPKEAVRWLSNTEIAKVKAGDRTILGLCTHAQINPENRTDPGKGYAYDLLLYWIKWYHPDFPEGEDEFDMDKTDIYNAVWRQDGLMEGPTANPDNPHWWPENVVERIARQAENLRAENKVIIAEIKANRAAFEAAIQALAEAIGTGVDPEKINALVEAKVDEALAQVTVEFSRDEGEAPAQ